MTRPAASSQTLSRGLDVLELIARSPTLMTVAQISHSLDLSRTIVYRLVGTLLEHGLVVRGPDGSLSIGVAAVQLGANRIPVLRELVRPTLESLAEDLAATAHFSIGEGGESLAVSVVEPSQTDFHVAYRVGSRHSLSQGAVGRALVAAAAGVTEIFESHGELIQGATGIAASIPGPAGPAACVGIVTLTPLRSSEMGPRVLSAAAALLEVFGTESAMVAPSKS